MGHRRSGQPHSRGQSSLCAGCANETCWPRLLLISPLAPSWQELFDTVLLVLKKRPVITLHWFHHASVIGFAWAAWAYETPAALWYGAMNYTVHSIMYTYFALTAVPRVREAVLRFAPAVTSLQLSQFAFGTIVNGFAAVAYLSPGVGCAIQPAILQLAAALYLAYGALFLRLFVRRYLRPSGLSKGMSGVDAPSSLPKTGGERVLDLENGDTHTTDRINAKGKGV